MAATPTPTSPDPTSESTVDTASTAVSAGGVTPITVVARRRAIRRMVFAVVLVVIGVAAWKMIPDRSPDADRLSPQGAQTAATTRTEALQTVTSTQASTSATNMLNAGVIAAQNYHTAMDTWDGFAFPGVTVITGPTGAVLIVQESGTCFTRTVTDQAAPTAVVNDPRSCTAQEQLRLQKALS